MDKTIVSFFTKRGVIELFLPALLTFIPVMATVYLLGKMLGIVRTPKKKNTVAFISIIVYSVFYDILMNQLPSIDTFMQRAWNLLIYMGILILLYVLIGFRLSTRVDSFLDKKLGEASIEDEIKEDTFFLHDGETTEPKKATKPRTRKPRTPKK